MSVDTTYLLSLGDIIEPLELYPAAFPHTRTYQCAKECHDLICTTYDHVIQHIHTVCNTTITYSDRVSKYIDIDVYFSIYFPPLFTFHLPNLRQYTVRIIEFVRLLYFRQIQHKLAYISDLEKWNCRYNNFPSNSPKQVKQCSSASKYCDLDTENIPWNVPQIGGRACKRISKSVVEKYASQIPSATEILNKRRK